MMNKKTHIIKEVVPGSAAYLYGIVPGDLLVGINGSPVEDIFDYQYLVTDEECSMEIMDASGKKRKVLIEKGLDEDPGLLFEEDLMDHYRSCCNKCIFCFIDQMPKGMRDTLYFKDDDSRLSFLQGNYITLTNMSDKDIDRIIRYNLSPVNISFQTTNPELRVKMMGNRFAGEALKKAGRLNEAGIEMNGQIVLCKGINDGSELERTVSDLEKYIPNLKSVSVVPVGLSKYRQGLFKLEPFTKEDAAEVIGFIEERQKKLYKKYGTHFIHASDEWYIKAGYRLPEAQSYDGYLQLENGVGMLRLLLDEFEEELAGLHKSKNKDEFSCITGLLSYPYILEMTERMKEYYPDTRVNVYGIKNDFFGENITVTGLLTGQDIINQLKGKSLGSRLYIPENVLRAGTEVLLDDVTLSGISEALQVKVDIVKSSGMSFIGMYTGQSYQA